MDETFLQKIEVEEAADVEAMARRIWPEAYARIITREQIDYMLDWMYSPETIVREIEEGGIQYFWIVSNEEQVGFLGVGPVKHNEPAFLHKFYVLREKAGQGIGSRTLGLLAGMLGKTGVPDLELRVNRHNSAAVGFYKKNGFEIVSEDEADIGGGFAMDDFIMRRTL